MSNRYAIWGILLTLGAPLWGALPGCSSSAQPGTSADVASDEAALDAAQTSLSSAKEQASACFDTFRTCSTADGADIEVCREALTACLPTDAVVPSLCGAGRGGHGHARDDDSAGMGSLPDVDDDTSAGGRPAMLAHPHRGERHPAGVDEALAGDTGDVEEGHRHGCEKPPIDAAVKGCAENASATLDDPTAIDAASTAHADCMNNAFANYFEHICTEATARCGDAAAPADTCARIAEMCSAIGGGS